ARSAASLLKCAVAMTLFAAPCSHTKMMLGDAALVFEVWPSTFNRVESVRSIAIIGCTSESECVLQFRRTAVEARREAVVVERSDPAWPTLVPRRGRTCSSSNSSKMLVDLVRDEVKVLLPAGERGAAPAEAIAQLSVAACSDCCCGGATEKCECRLRKSVPCFDDSRFGSGGRHWALEPGMNGPARSPQPPTVHRMRSHRTA